MLTPDEFMTAIQKTAQSAFGCKSRAQIVADIFPLLTELRNEHMASWKAIARLFNAAIAGLEIAEIEPVTLCRLYNIEKKNQGLLAAIRAAPNPGAVHSHGSRVQPAAAHGAPPNDGNPELEVDAPTKLRPQPREPTPSSSTNLIAKARITAADHDRFDQVIRRSADQI